MNKLTSIVSATAASIAALALSASPAMAQTQQAKFSADESAYCAATFGWILEFLAPNGLPQEAAVQSNIAFMMWNYELNTAMGNADEATYKAKADSAIKKLADKIPSNGESQEDIQKVVDLVYKEAAACGKKLETAYPDGKHPVIAALQQQAAAAKAKAAQEAKPAQ